MKHLSNQVLKISNQRTVKKMRKASTIERAIKLKKYIKERFPDECTT